MFVGYDRDGKAAFASLRGTYDRDGSGFKGDAAGKMCIRDRAHPPDAEWQADADPHKEVVTYAVRHIDRLEK